MMDENFGIIRLWASPNIAADTIEMEILIVHLVLWAHTHTYRYMICLFVYSLALIQHSHSHLSELSEAHRSCHWKLTWIFVVCICVCYGLPTCLLLIAVGDNDASNSTTIPESSDVCMLYMRVAAPSSTNDNRCAENSVSNDEIPKTFIIINHNGRGAHVCVYCVPLAQKWAINWSLIQVYRCVV